MGVDRSDYVLMGFEATEALSKLDEDQKDELYDTYYHSNKAVGSIILLNDNYSGKYVYFGVILQVDKDGYNGLQPMEYRDGDYLKEKDIIEKAAWRELNIDDEAKFIVLTHWH